MELNNLKYAYGSRGHKRKVVGRGYGSGMGKRSTRGQKGQKARKSGQVRPGFEGGQTPIYRRLPKVGFNNANFARRYYVITLNKIDALPEKEITLDVLHQHRLIRGRHARLPIKVIGYLEMTSSKVVHAHHFSANAKLAIEKANGSVVVIK